MRLSKQQAEDISRSIELAGRKMDFEFELEDIPRHWIKDNIFRSTFMNSLSCMFPEGERMFMDAVRDCQKLIEDPSPELLSQIKGFIKQEAIHGHEHAQHNDFLRRWGYPIDKINRFEEREKIWMRKNVPASYRLAITCALEHFTAIMAHQVLTNPLATDGMHPQFKELWRWHAIEETEHKAVAFDVYQAAVGKYWLRVLTMLQVTFFFCLRTTIYQMIFLWKDGQLFNPRVWWQGLKFYFFENNFRGLVPSIFKDYLDYFRRDFHPWQHDNRDLLKDWNDEGHSYKTV